MKKTIQKSLKVSALGFLLTNVFGCAVQPPFSPLQTSTLNPQQPSVDSQHMDELANAARLDRLTRSLQEDRQIRVPNYVSTAFSKPIILAPKTAQVCQIDNVTTPRGPEYNVELISVTDNRTQKTIRELTKADSSTLITGSGVLSSNPNDKFGYIFKIVVDPDNKYCLLDTEKMGTRAYHLKETTFNGNDVRGFINKFDF